jgi:hypothetical protein
MSFRQIATAIRHDKDCFKVQKLGDINDHNVGQYVHVLVATKLNKIANLLLRLLIWAFFIVGDGSTHCTNSLFDMCIGIYISDILFNLHLAAIPMFKWHTVENIFNLIAHFLYALDDMTTIWFA